MKKRRPSQTSKDGVEKKLGTWCSHQVTNYDANVDDSKRTMKSNLRLRTRWESFIKEHGDMFLSDEEKWFVQMQDVEDALVITGIESDGDSSVESDTLQCRGCTNPLHPLCPHALCASCCTGLGCGVHSVGADREKDCEGCGGEVWHEPPSTEVRVKEEGSGDEQRFEVALDEPLRGTEVWRDGRLWLDGRRVGEHQTPRELGAVDGSALLLQTYEQQSGGAGSYDENVALVFQILELGKDRPERPRTSARRRCPLP